jgi:hypothetical protein
LDPVPESDSDDVSLPTPPSVPTRPRAHTVQSEGSGLTIFTNGHHKPAHKHNQAAHKCGMPYVVPRAHTIHGSTPASLANRSVDNLPHVSTVDALHSESRLKDSIVSAQQEQRMAKSEHNSPFLGSTNIEQLNSQLSPLDIPNPDGFPVAFNFPMEYDGLPHFADADLPIFSAGLSAPPVDWSHYDLDFNNDNFAPSNFSQAASFVGYDFSSIDQPALTTTSTSGEISEVEDFLPPAAVTMMAQKYGSEFDNSDRGDAEAYRLSAASSYISVPQAHMLASTDVASLDIDDFLRGIPTTNVVNSMPLNVPTTTFEEVPKFLPGAFDDSAFQLPPVDSEEALWMNDFTANTTISYGELNLDAADPNVWTQ